MRKHYFMLILTLAALFANAQVDGLTRTRFVIGISGPELLHTGINVNLSKSSQVGITAGVGPTWGGVWPSLNMEHRLYFGGLRGLSNRKKWFFRQGGTYFPSGKDGAATLSIGADLGSKHINKGWTIDVGLSRYYPGSEHLEYLPSLRFQFYSIFKK